MKAISLHQPWASLVAMGLKRVETRSWPTRHRGWIAIHAAKRWSRSQRVASVGFLGSDPDIPLGAVVAIARVSDCVLMTPALIESQTPRELAVGDWTAGRWAWLLEDVRRLRDPVPFVGRQGLFTVPDAIGW